MDKSADSELGKWTRSIRNRTQSIVEDASFVTAVGDAYKLPLVPNKRCGLWYVPPALRADESYFKSTDGHTGQWSFSVKRLNAHILPLVAERGGIVLVDSTRRGKRMPDAFSKTVPIWCAVINAVAGLSDDLWLPSRVVSASEADQIRQHLPQWVSLVRKSPAARELIMEQASRLAKPLRPIWVTQDGPLPIEAPEFADFYPIVLCTASRIAQDGEYNSRGYAYVQGAADDHELWAGKLTPELLWSFPELRENTADSVLKHRLQSIGEATSTSSLAPRPTVLLHPTRYFIVTTESPPNSPHFIDLRNPPVGSQGAAEGRWPIENGKRGARQLSSILGSICDYFERHRSSTIVVTSEAVDSAVCVALALDCIFFADDGTAYPSRRKHIPKPEAAERLVRIAAAVGGAPPRASTNIVGAFLRS